MKTELKKICQAFDRYYNETHTLYISHNQLLINIMSILTCIYFQFIRKSET